ncbi:cyclase family protein [Microbaculum marinum]|uniref:Cyclase family protein n=1 Tax=Microbaculum marinum TaxID=1764581 RepID=A0AAW9RWU3_9HYPH
MCVPGCHEAVMRQLSRRGFFRGVGAATLAAATLPAAVAPARAQTVSFQKAVDLTHSLPPDFPTYFGDPQLEIEKVFAFDKDGFNLNVWHLNEHTGTHMDAPIHFSQDGQSADQIEIEKLVVPIAVIDVKAKAAEDPDYQVSPDDIRAWESANGELPEGCCVAMNSGWDAHVGTDKFRNADGDGVMHFPGFHPEAADMMISDRKVVGMGVDTLSLDFGKSPDFKTHYTWLPTGRWGMEAIANLDAIPASGATLVVGSPKIVGATGGPSRLIALV